MRLLVTGGAGYVGSVLVPMLIDRGYDVRIVDIGMFGTGHVDPRAELIQGDVLDFQPSWLDGVDGGVHLAGLSNDPMAAFSPNLNYLLNASGTAIVAHAAKEAGLRRFVFGSTCSVYGLNDSAEVNEDHDVNPSFPYAVSKLMGERCVTCLADDDFRPIILRKGTVVGWSPRMRFDLVTNAMVKSAVTQGRITVHNASLWRPVIDVTDAARAYIKALEAEPTVTGIFNIAARNYSIGELAEVVAETLREFDIRVLLVMDHRQDVRSYRVSTQRATRLLKFRAHVPMKETVRRIMRQLNLGMVSDFEDPCYYNVEQMKRVLTDEIAPRRMLKAA